MVRSSDRPSDAGERVRLHAFNYGLALLAIAIAWVARLMLEPLLLGRYPLATFYAAVAVIGWYRGTRPAIFAAVVGCSVDYIVGLGGGAFGAEPVDATARAAYLGLCAALIAFVHRVHDRQARLDQALTHQEATRAALHAAEERRHLGDLEREAAAHARDAALEQLQLVTATMSAGVTRCTREFTYAWVNPAYARWLGRTPAEIEGRSFDSVIGREAVERLRPYFDRVLAGESVEYEDRVTFHGPGSRWIHATYTPTRDSHGRVDGWVAVVVDQTEQHAFETALRDSEERLRLALEGGRIGMWSLDLETGLTHCTPHNFAIFGLPADSEAVTVERLYALIHPDDRDHVQREWQRALERRSTYEIEYRIVRPDGALRWAMSRGNIQEVGGRPARVIGVTLDVSERMLAENALRDANRRKDEFLATLVHELRNPLAPIRLASRLFRAGTPPEMIEDVGRMIDRQLAHMARLLDDLLDVSRITRGTLELRTATVDMRTVVQEALGAVHAIAEKSERTLEMHVESTPLPVRGDATRLAQLLGNLLNNAIKYTDAGGHIVVSAHATGTEVVVEVRDDGIGIPVELLPRIFDLFTQGDKGTRAASGLGIGLSLARQLATLHGGELEAHSTGPGQGSRFVLRLPQLEEPPAISSEAALATNVVVLGAAGTRVLVVDDNVDAADALTYVLQLAGFPVRAVYDGASALDLAASMRPDVVLLDLGLPQMSGYEVARRLRAMPWARAVRLIAITGWGAEADRRASREAGIDEHLTKPVDPDSLLRLLALGARASA